MPQPDGTDLLGPAGGRCVDCLLRPLPFERARAAVVYDEVARRFLLRAKLGRRPELLPILGAQLAGAVLADAAAADCRAVVPVPAHPLALLRRGFDPAREIGEALARRLGVPLDRRTIVRRLARVTTAKRLGAAERRRARARAFRAARDVRDPRVLLVDDVLTTGATAAACAAALRAAGAERVCLAVWARTPAPSG